VLLALLSFGVPLYLGVIGFPALPRSETVLPRGWMDITGLPHPVPASLVDAVGAPPLIAGLVGSLLLGGLYLAALIAARRRQRVLGSSAALPTGLRLISSQSISAGLGLVAVALIPPMILASTVVGLGVITRELVEVLLGNAGSVGAFTLIELVRNLYLNQASALLTASLAVAAALGLLTLVIGGIMAPRNS
jgi:hypothetical protein